ncbi:replication initiation protein, RepL2 [Kitasatospora sp. NPDC088783]|uniref:replication initiation protein, RepL2 n=1 Tax=Kitasatospora sp. NPDC088783 TaxID=3364077 RepID=UPI003800D2E3
MQIESRHDVVKIMKRVSGLAPNLRQIVMLYASLDQDPSTGAVPIDAKEIAAEINMDPSLFSRLRGQLVERGWMEKIEDTVYYRLTSLADSPDNVLPLRRTGPTNPHEAKRA